VSVGILVLIFYCFWRVISRLVDSTLCFVNSYLLVLTLTSIVACVPAIGCYPGVFTDRNTVVSVVVEWVTDPPFMVYVINAVNESSVYNITLLTSTVYQTGLD